MAKTLSDILLDIGSFVDLEAALPTGDELLTRVNYVNQAVLDAFSVTQLSEFTKMYESTMGSGITVSLPSDFHELKTNPRQYTGGTWQEYPEILPEEKYNKTAGEKYCYVLGNASSGNYLILNGYTAGDTLSFPYIKTPATMATLTDVCELADPQFVVAKAESYVLQSRGDDRFPYVDAVSEKKLKNMVGRDMKSPGGQGRVTSAGFKNPLGG